MIAVQICSGTEWRAMKELLAPIGLAIETYPFGEYARHLAQNEDVIFFYCRRTKVRAAGACQFAIDHWRPKGVLVMGTCAGVQSGLSVGDMIIATEVVQTDSDDHRPSMGGVVKLNVPSDFPYLSKLIPGKLATADQDLAFSRVAELRKADFLGADWESAAIAAVCALNETPCAILRSISDVPLEDSPADYQRQLGEYENNTPKIMETYLAIVLTEFLIQAD